MRVFYQIADELSFELVENSPNVILDLIENLILSQAENDSIVQDDKADTSRLSLTILVEGSLEEYYNGLMVRFLPFSFLLAFASIFGLAWIVTGFDPDEAVWYIFALFVVLLFLFLINILGLILYFLRTKLYKRYSSKWYVFTSYKMAFFVAIFVAVVAILAILDLVSKINVFLAIVAVGLFAIWSFLGKKVKGKEE